VSAVTAFLSQRKVLFPPVYFVLRDVKVCTHDPRQGGYRCSTANEIVRQRVRVGSLLAFRDLRGRMWKCRRCGKQVEDNVDVCWNCQTRKPASSTAGSRTKVKRRGATRSNESIELQAWQPWRSNPYTPVPTDAENANPTGDSNRRPLKFRHYIILVLGGFFLLMYFASIVVILFDKGGRWDTDAVEGMHIGLCLGLLLCCVGLRPALIRRPIVWSRTWKFTLGFVGVILSFSLGGWIWGLASLVVVPLAMVVGAAIANKWEERRRLMDRADVDSMVVATGENPVCPKCRTIYSRVAVVRQLKQQSPEMFDFGMWTTRFRCVKCGEDVAISGRSGE
jgi:hypothetical protein